jgi:hypothetical protein
LKQFNKVMGLTALLGWLPVLLALLAVQFGLAHGAGEWGDLTFDAVFVGLYLVLLGAGAYVYTRWFS